MVNLRTRCYHHKDNSLLMGGISCSSLCSGCFTISSGWPFWTCSCPFRFQQSIMWQHVPLCRVWSVTVSTLRGISLHVTLATRELLDEIRVDKIQFEVWLYCSTFFASGTTTTSFFSCCTFGCCCGVSCFFLLPDRQWKKPISNHQLWPQHNISYLLTNLVKTIYLFHPCRYIFI